MKTDNELIAEFMGIHVRDWSGVLFYSDEDGYVDIAGDAQPYWPDKSWNQLMSVVEKIQSIGYHTSMYHDCDKLTYTYRNEMRIVNSDESKIRYRELSNGETMIQCVYTAVVQFVKWHNQLT
jgi:hypothetical protein